MQTERSEEKDFVGTQIFWQLLQGHVQLRNVVKLFKQEVSTTAEW